MALTPRQLQYARTYREKNRSKCNEASRRSRRRHPRTDVEGHLWRKYKLTLEDYNRQLENQAGLCKICRGSPNGRTKKLVVDHCHRTKTFRGLLCDRCNRGLGFFKESVTSLQRAIAYLEAA